MPHPNRSSSSGDDTDSRGMQTRSKRKRTRAVSEDETSIRQSPRRKPGSSSTTNDIADKELSRQKIPRRKQVNDDGATTSRQQGIGNALRSSPRKVAVVRPSGMAKTKRVSRTIRGHKATAELVDNPVQSNQKTRTVKVTVEGIYLFNLHPGWGHKAVMSSLHQYLSWAICCDCPQDKLTVGSSTTTVLPDVLCIAVSMQYSHM